MAHVPNIIDYVRTELADFSERELNRVDSLVFSWLAYFRMPAAVRREGMGLAVRDLYRAEWAEQLLDSVFDPVSSWALLQALAASPRFRNVRVSDHVAVSDEATEQQFSATTFRLPSVGTYVAFRGTDNTLVGWKEDFNMAFCDAVPSQRSAAAYLERIAEATTGSLWAGGHSKGGNLAVYAAATGNLDQSRLVRVFSHDGPGFPAKVRADVRWERIAPIVDKTVPQSSIVGMLFEGQEGTCTVVRSDAVGFSQHDPFSWEVDGRDFSVVERVGHAASALDGSINTWLETSMPEERERFVDAIFGVLAASGCERFADIKANWRTSLPRMAAAVAALDPAERAVVGAALREIAGRLVPGARETLTAWLPL